MNRSREHARALLKKAGEDAWALVHLATEPDAPLAVLGFHAQQAVEKALKAVLASRSVEYPRTHNLGLLTAMVRDQRMDPPRTDLMAALTAFGVGMRYPADLPEAWPEGLDAKQAKKVAQDVLAWATAQVNGESAE